VAAHKIDGGKRPRVASQCNKGVLGMKNRILGIAALLAVVAVGFAFITCGSEDRVCDFTNYTSTAIKVTAQGSSPASFTLKGLKKVLGTPDTQTVTRAGKDIEITGISFPDYPTLDGAWEDEVEMKGSPKSGSVEFRPKGELLNPQN